MFTLTRTVAIGLMLCCFAGMVVPDSLPAQNVPGSVTLPLVAPETLAHPASASLSLVTLPVQVGTHTLMVTCTPEFAVFRLPSSIASGVVFSFGRLVPGNLIVSGGSDPQVISLNPDSGFSFLKDLIPGFGLASPSPDVSSVPAGAHPGPGIFPRIRSVFEGSPLWKTLAFWGLMGLALASLMWSFLWSHQTHLAAGALRQFPLSSLAMGAGGLVCLALGLWAGWPSSPGLILILFMILPVFPVFLLAPAVTAVSVGQFFFPGANVSRARPLLQALLVPCCWLLVFLPVIGVFLFALTSVWGLGGLMLAGIFPVPESEKKSKEDVPC